jgi:cobalt-zinc-cadmium efflux system membrane fusion protein
MAAPLTVPRPKVETPARKSRPIIRKIVTAAVVVAVAGVAAYLSGLTSIAALKEMVKHYTTVEVIEPDPLLDKSLTGGPWDGLIAISAEEEKAIGFDFAPVLEQTEPIKLELNGRTAYDPNTITKVRPRFDTRVEKVFAELGQKVKKGDPLVALSSTDLAAAKSDFQQKYVQWQHDLKLKNLRKRLFEDKAISEQLWVDTQNDEQKSRLDFGLAYDKLTVTYEVPKEQLDPLLENLADRDVLARQFGNMPDKARLTILSKGDGIVIKRDVVPGNFYETTDVLMEIAPLDHLWVEVNVYEADQDKVELNQKMTIQFLSHEQKVEGKVNYVASEVSKDTRAVRVRATIRNPDSRLKSDMLVKAMLEIPKIPGQTVVPRLSVVSVSGVEYVFVRKFKNLTVGSDEKKVVDKFERRKVDIAQENDNTAIIASGLTPGMEVATNGSLILAQLYEDQRTSKTGLPVQ